MTKTATTTTVVVLVEAATKERVEAPAPADVRTESAAAAAGGITVPLVSGAFPRDLNAGHRFPLVQPGLPKSPLSSPVKMKVRNKCRRKEIPLGLAAGGSDSFISVCVGRV